MRNHFISSAPEGHPFNAANRTISGKLQRLGTIILVIREPLHESQGLGSDGLAPGRQSFVPPIVAVRGARAAQQ